MATSHPVALANEPVCMVFVADGTPSSSTRKVSPVTTSFSVAHVRRVAERVIFARFADERLAERAHGVVGASRWASLNASRQVVDLGMLHPTSTATSTAAIGIRDENTDLQGSGDADAAASSADPGEDQHGSNQTTVEEKDDLCGQATDAKDDAQHDADIALTSDANAESVAAENNQHQGDDEPLKPCGPNEEGESMNDGGAPATDTPDEPPSSDAADASSGNAPDHAHDNALPGARLTP
jgi:hypothetical protein